NLADTYFGRGNSPQSCGITITGNILTNTLNARDVGAATGSQVTNLNTSESFCSIQAAIDDAQTLNGHVLNVASGTFNESVVINKEVTIKGNGGSPNTRPIVEGVSGQAISVTVPNVTIDNMIVKFNQGTVNTGIRALTSGSFNNLTVKNSKIYGTATTGVVIFGSYAMQLGTAGGALSDKVNLDSNEITHSGTSPLGRGVRTNNCYGDWKNSRINGYYTIQAGTSQGGIMNITNDSLYGETEINYLGAGTHSFSNNYCNVSNAFGGGTDYALLELKDISLAGANLTVSGNKFQDFVNFGIFSGRSNNVTIDNNQFLPDPTAVNFRSVRIDSKQRTIAPQPAFVSGAVITKNTFTGNVALGQNGIFVELASSDNISSIGSVTIGTSGNENNFGNNIKKIISLNNETTSTSGDPAWFGTYISTKGKVTTNVNAANNNYDVGAGLQLPTAMTLANLFALEDKIQHTLDDGGLGFVTAKANNDYVTVNSFVTPATTSASVQRGIDASSSGWNVNVADGTYNGDIEINKPITVVGASTAAIIRGLYAGSANTVFITSSNATIKKVTVTRDYGVDLNAWYACTKNQGISLAQTTTGIVIENVLLTGNRNAIFVNNAQNVTITKCTIENNRTGIHFGNDFSGAEVHNNFIRNNFTHGVLFNYDLLVGIVCTDVHITENSITGNWYSQVNFQRNSGPVPAGDHTGLSFSCNWYGTPSPGQSDANAAEPGYSSQPPSQFGGLDPGLNRQLYGVEIARCPYNYYLTNGADNDLLTEGFQPVPASCNGLASSVITIKVIPEGFYNTVTQRLNMRDTVKAYLHSTTSPYPLLDSSTAIIDSVSFAGIFTFTQPTGTYYIVVKHRNSLETWSKAGGEPFVASTMMTYDFTDLSSKAYQNNMVQVDASPVRFAIYSGDVTRDGTIDLSDMIEISNDVAIFATGYKKTDVTGDNVTELTDLLITNNNNAFGISVKKP
ncbi:MAG TPA: right-handed parallel beta-helix repeat-containing protein, partial [Ignavibacteria bacterium]|nr:right-handed parallel beta-helix repeat-containing protein [Ignavibacteria bacterium]